MSVEVVRRNLTAGDGTVEYVQKVKLIDKARMQQLLAQHVGLLKGESLQKPPSVPAFIQRLPGHCCSVTDESGDREARDLD